jgi:hypothetical protein
MQNLKMEDEEIRLRQINMLVLKDYCSLHFTQLLVGFQFTFILFVFLCVRRWQMNK